MDDIDHMDDVAETDEENDNDSKELSDQEEDLEENLKNLEKADRGSSPPLESMIPSNHIAAAGNPGNPLDNLKEKYHKQQLPQSLQPVQNGHVDPKAISTV